MQTTTTIRERVDVYRQTDPAIDGRPIPRIHVRAGLGREGFRRARLLAWASGRVAAPGPDLTVDDEDVA